MKRNPRSPRTIASRDRRFGLEVPAFQPDAEKTQDEPAQAAPEQGAAEETVRRMVEAAYT